MAEEFQFINYATTLLLAAADASVGGKTAVDTPLATNLKWGERMNNKFWNRMANSYDKSVEKI